MEAFKYYMNFNLQNSNTNIEKTNDINSTLDTIKYVENWSLFTANQKKIVIKKNIGKLIGYSGETISKLRSNNKNLIIKINNQINKSQNREVYLIGEDKNINNVIEEIKKIIGKENIIY